jgi:hypothetical protein
MKQEISPKETCRAYAFEMWMKAFVNNILGIMDMCLKMKEKGIWAARPKNTACLIAQLDVPSLQTRLS